MGPRG